jgi:hypothetical protein
MINSERRQQTADELAASGYYYANESGFAYAFAKQLYNALASALTLFTQKLPPADIYYSGVTM